MSATIYLHWAATPYSRGWLASAVTPVSAPVTGSFDVVPTFREDQVQPAVGWPLFEMTLQSGNAPVILRGILRENRAWCRVLEFVEEFGISVSFQPFTLLERRGG